MTKIYIVIVGNSYLLYGWYRRLLLLLLLLLVDCRLWLLWLVEGWYLGCFR